MLKEKVDLFRGSSVLFEKDEAQPTEGDKAAVNRVHFTFSTDDIDSYGDIIEQDGWILDRFVKNPIILWAHDHRIPGIGIADNVSKAPALNGFITYNPKDIDEFGYKIGQMVRAKIIRAGSVGFNPLKWDVIEHKEGSYTVIDGFRFKEQELFEFSNCNVPANPFCLSDQKMMDLNAQKSFVKPRSGGFSMFLG